MYPLRRQLIRQQKAAATRTTTESVRVNGVQTNVILFSSFCSCFDCSSCSGRSPGVLAGLLTEPPKSYVLAGLLTKPAKSYVLAGLLTKPAKPYVLAGLLTEPAKPYVLAGLLTEPDSATGTVSIVRGQETRAQRGDLTVKLLCGVRRPAHN